MTKDPVCGMILSEEKALFKYEYKGNTFYFCGEGCLERFRRDPEGYLKGKKDWIADEGN